MSGIDKDWISELDHQSLRYLTGVSDFIEFVKKNGGGHTRYSCPCKICRNGKGMVELQTIAYHLLDEGIDQSYTVWKFYGKNDTVKEKQHSTNKSSENNIEVEHPRMEELVNDAFEMHLAEATDPLGDTEEGPSNVHVDREKSKVGKKYKSLCSTASEPLYPSCPNDKTTLYAVVKLNSIKTQFGWSGNSVTALLGLLKELLPEGNKLPTKYSDVKSIIKEIGMDYKTYHACVNDCIIYWKEHENRISCPHCKAPRYKVSLKPVTTHSKVPQKTLRHFPIIPRLKRLYSVPWIANEMTWHHRADSGPDVMRHPVDSLAWQCANTSWLEFASEPRNVHLGLSTDGFNPYGSLSSSYNCWPVILVPYNLPLKREFSMLSLLISGPKAPSKDIDVYLEPLIDELKQLCLETNAVSKSVGKSTRGRTIAYGMVSMTQIKAAAPVLAKLASYKSKASGLEAKVNNLEEVVVTSLGNMESRLDDTYGNQQCTQPSSMSGSNYSAPLSEYAHYTKCELHNIADEVIAYGRLIKDSTAGVIHGTPVPSTEDKILLDKILFPMEKLSKVNHSFAETFVEIGVGGYVAHPKFLIHYI